MLLMFEKKSSSVDLKSTDIKKMIVHIAYIYRSQTSDILVSQWGQRWCCVNYWLLIQWLTRIKAHDDIAYVRPNTQYSLKLRNFHSTNGYILNQFVVILVCSERGVETVADCFSMRRSMNNCCVLACHMIIKPCNGMLWSRDQPPHSLTPVTARMQN